MPAASEAQSGSYRYEPMTGTPRLRVSNLDVTYIDRTGRKTEAVRDVSFDIPDKPGSGEVVVFLGPSGCGKSTILKAVAGLLPPTNGEISRRWQARSTTWGATAGWCSRPTRRLPG